MLLSRDKHNKLVGFNVPIVGEIPIYPKRIWAELRMREGSPLWAQLFKYGICGIIATLVLTACYAYANWKFPDYLSQDLPKTEFKRNFAWVMFYSFVAANLVAYFSNRFFVFTPGKHRFWIEMVIFFGVSAASFYGGEIAKNYIIDQGMHKHIAFSSFAVSSALVNFIARKYLVFNGARENSSI